MYYAPGYSLPPLRGFVPSLDSCPTATPIENALVLFCCNDGGILFATPRQKSSAVHGRDPEPNRQPNMTTLTVRMEPACLANSLASRITNLDVAVRIACCRDSKDGYNLERARVCWPGQWTVCAQS